jgi:hypothetical protein
LFFLSRHKTAIIAPVSKITAAIFSYHHRHSLYHHCHHHRRHYRRHRHFYRHHCRRRHHTAAITVIVATIVVIVAVTCSLAPFVPRSVTVPPLSSSPYNCTLIVAIARH